MADKKRVLILCTGNEQMRFVDNDRNETSKTRWAKSSSLCSSSRKFLDRKSLTASRGSVQQVCGVAEAYWLFTVGLIGTGLLGVPVLAGSCAYAMAEASAWRGSLEKKPRNAWRFYIILAGAMTGGLAIDFVGLNPVKIDVLVRRVERRSGAAIDPSGRSPHQQPRRNG